MNKKAIAISIVFIIILMGAGMWFLRSPVNPQKYSGPVEKLRFCTSMQSVSAPIFVAQAKNYFIKHGLDIDFTYHTAGILCLQDLIDRKMDVATVAGTGFVFKNLEHPGLKILASLATSETAIRLVARKSIISKPADLKGKTIGTTIGTDAHFFLNSLLIFAGLNTSDVKILNFKPDELPSALSDGKVDAIVTWEPNITNAQKALGDNAITLPAQIGNKSYWLLVSRQDVINEKSEIINRLLTALLEADTYIEFSPIESKDILSRYTNPTFAYLEKAFSEYTFSTLLSQDMIVALENTTRWAIKNKLTDQTKIPNYLNNIYFDALEAVKPEAVNIIH